MRVTERQDSEVRIRLPKITADAVIDERIPAPLPNTSFFMAVIGTPGSGKSSTAVSLLTSKGLSRAYRRAFNHIYIVCPAHSLHSYANDPFKSHPRDKIFHELTQNTLGKIEERLEESSLEDETALVFLDDCAIALKDKEVQRSLNRIVANRRHLKTSLIVIAQSFRFMPLSTRRLVSHLLWFKPANRKERDLVHEELLSHLDESTFDAIFKHTFQEKHDHLLVDVTNARLYRNFNSLEFG